jgi:hypothetical protein
VRLLAEAPREQVIDMLGMSLRPLSPIPTNAGSWRTCWPGRAFAPMSGLSSSIREGGEIEDLTTTIEPDIDTDVRPLRLGFVR